MHIDTNFPPNGGRLAQFMRVVADFERDEIEAAVDGFIAMLDAIDGDADDEPNGDELDGCSGEDEFMRHAGDGPGCPISDPGGNGDPYATDDDEEDCRPARRRHRDYIGRTQCRMTERRFPRLGGGIEIMRDYRLIDPDTKSVRIGMASELPA